MITFSRSGSNVYVYLKIEMASANEVIAKIECGNELYAELLRNKLVEKLSDKVEAIRKIEYRRGRRREKKQDYFHYMFDTSDYSKI